MDGMEKGTESKAYPMEDDYDGMEVTNCDIKMAKNGYIVSASYREKSKGGSSSMDHCHYKSMKEVFGEKEEEQAWAKFKEYKMMEMHRDYKNKEVY
jgi:hypothetical protein